MMLLPALIAISSYSDGSASIQVMAGARAFYSAIRPQVGTGVPDALHLKLLRPYISDRLADLLRAADEAEAKNAAQPVPEGEGNPPLFEGDIYSPYAEGFTSYKVLSAAPEGTVWVCKVQLTYVETGAEPMIWMDRATMVFE